MHGSLVWPTAAVRPRMVRVCDVEASHRRTGGWCWSSRAATSRRCRMGRFRLAQGGVVQRQLPTVTGVDGLALLTLSTLSVPTATTS